MKIILLKNAQKELQKLPKIDQIAVAKKIRSLSSEKVIPKEEKLAGFPQVARVRVGNYRIVYKKTSEIIYIILIRHRKEVYRILNKLLK